MSHLYFLHVQNAALAAMKDEMLELASRFTRVTKERDYMEKALNRLQVSSRSSLSFFLLITLQFLNFGNKILGYWPAVLVHN